MHRGNVGGSLFLRPVMSLHFSKNIMKKNSFTLSICCRNLTTPQLYEKKTNLFTVTTTEAWKQKEKRLHFTVQGLQKDLQRVHSLRRKDPVRSGGRIGGGKAELRTFSAGSVGVDWTNA